MAWIPVVLAAMASVAADTNTNSQVPSLEIRWTMQAIVGAKLHNGFTTTAYRKSVLPKAITNAPLLTAPAYIDGVNVEDLAVGGKWSGVVLEAGVVTNRAEKREFIRFVVKDYAKKERK